MILMSHWRVKCLGRDMLIQNFFSETEKNHKIIPEQNWLIVILLVFNFSTYDATALRILCMQFSLNAMQKHCKFGCRATLEDTFFDVDVKNSK